MIELKGFSGELITPGDGSYDEARKIFNGMIDRKPAAIALCSSPDDVIAAVNFARGQGLDLAVRGGGHGVAGQAVCDNGLVIDLSGMQEVVVDPGAKSTRCGGGTLWGQFDKATEPHGLVTPGGRMTTTGVGGFTLGGGYGWLSSKFGLACDNLISAQVVTADGRLLTASEDENEDLFWGLRGGSGNFGVVTSFEFRLHELPTAICAGLAMWPLERAAEVLPAYRDWADAAPDEVCTGCVVLTAPPEEFVPEHLRGQTVLGLAGSYAGDPAEGQEAFRQMKELEPALDLIVPMPYTAFQAILDPPNPPGMRNYWQSSYMSQLSDAAIEEFLARAPDKGSPLSDILLFRLGGAVSAVPDDATAFSNREWPWMFHPISMWADPADDARIVAWTREYTDAMRPYTSDSLYLNFTADADEGSVRAGYGDAKYERLVALKDRYDPENLFRLNQNIKPSGAAAPA